MYTGGGVSATANTDGKYQEILCINDVRLSLRPYDLPFCKFLCFNTNNIFSLMAGRGHSFKLFWARVVSSNFEEMFRRQTAWTGEAAKYATRFRLREADTNSDIWLELEK